MKLCNWRLEKQVNVAAAEGKIKPEKPTELYYYLSTNLQVKLSRLIEKKNTYIYNICLLLSSI
jgi:hypothetical protein